MRPLSIEVFVEPDCMACDEVLRVLHSLSAEHPASVTVFNRHKHQNAFLDRSVIISPATFINNKLAFYGAFSSDDFRRYLHSQQLLFHNTRSLSQ